MKNLIFEEIAELKEERRIAAQNRDEYLGKFKVAAKESDKAFEKMAFCRDQMIKARRERYRVRGEVGVEDGDYLIADAVYQVSLESYKREDEDFRQKFQKKMSLASCIIIIKIWCKICLGKLEQDIKNYQKRVKNPPQRPANNRRFFHAILGHQCWQQGEL